MLTTIASPPTLRAAQDEVRIDPGDRSIFSAMAAQGRLHLAESLLAPEVFKQLKAESEQELERASAPASEGRNRRALKRVLAPKTKPLPKEIPPAKVSAQQAAPKTTPAPPKKTPVTHPLPAQAVREILSRQRVEAPPQPRRAAPSTAAAPKPRQAPSVAPTGRNSGSQLDLLREIAAPTTTPEFLISLLTRPLPPLAERLCLDPRHPKLSKLAAEFPGTMNGATKGLVEILLSQAASACAARHTPAESELAKIYLGLERVLGSSSTARTVIEKFFGLLERGELRGN